MFAVVANGMQTICYTQRQLDTILAIYPYPKFRKFSDEDTAMEWLRANTRVNDLLRYNQYGETMTRGFASVEYFIANNSIYCNVRTKKVGFIRVWTEDENVKVDARPNMIKIKICNVVLDDEMIAHHILAIRRILRVLGEYVDVDIVLPDVSVYLAATKYKGSNYIIRGFQNDLRSRLGGVSFTIKER